MQCITFFKRSPLFELLPVFKTRFYIGDLKMLMYARFAIVEDVGFVADLMKFERNSPLQKHTSSINNINSTVSYVALSLNTGSNNDVMTFIFDADGNEICLKNGVLGISGEENPFIYQGVDEQGWYWGVRFTLSSQRLDAVAVNNPFLPGKKIFCNAYAFQREGEKRHFGGIQPFETKDVCDKRNLSEFCIVSLV